MGEDLLKKTGAGNLFMVFGEPDIRIEPQADGRLVVEVLGVDVYDPTTGQVRSNSTDDIACWFIDGARPGGTRRRGDGRVARRHAEGNAHVLALGWWCHVNRVLRRHEDHRGDAGRLVPSSTEPVPPCGMRDRSFGNR